MVELKGSGNARIVKGDVKEQTIQVHSSGDYYAPLVKSLNTEVESSGSGKTTIQASDRLIARIASSGDVIYAGQPMITYTLQGSGELRKRKA
jgi:hypothetical protein